MEAGAERAFEAAGVGCRMASVAGLQQADKQESEREG